MKFHIKDQNAKVIRLLECPSLEIAQLNISIGETLHEGDAEITNELPASRRNSIRNIKKSAGQEISAVLPVTKQINMMARGMELLANVVLEGASLTPSEQQEIADARGAWAVIKAIRAKSNADEAALPLDLT